MRSFGPIVTVTSGLRSALWTLLGTSILLMRRLNGFLPGRLNRRRLREFVDGISEFRLQGLFQEGRQILLRELFLPARTPFSENFGQLLLERFRDGVKWLIGLGPLNHRDSRRRVGSGRTLNRSERHELCFGRLQGFQI